MASVAVAILNYNGRHHLERFLPSVVEHSNPHVIYVIDNGSTDDSIEFLKAHYPEIKRIILPENTGYCGGYNRGLTQVEEEYAILLNSDIKVTSNWIAPVINYMEKNKGMIAAQPRILSLEQPDTFEYAGAGGGFIDKLGYPFCRGRVFQSLEKDTGQYDDQREIFWATGACMFVQMEAFRRLGGFDEDYFAHMEEIDFCWRAQHAGYRIGYQGKSEIFHLGGGTLPYKNPRKTFLNFRNNLRTLYKNLPGELMFPVFVSRLLLDGVASLRFLLGGDPGSCWSVFHAYLSLAWEWPRWNRKRKLMKRTKSADRHIFSGSIVFEYYIKRVREFGKLPF